MKTVTRTRTYTRTATMTTDAGLCEGPFASRTQGPTDRSVLLDLGATRGDSVRWTITVEVTGERGEPRHVAVGAEPAHGVLQLRVMDALRRAGELTVGEIRAALGRPADDEGVANSLRRLKRRGDVRIVRRGVYRLRRGAA